MQRKINNRSHGHWISKCCGAHCAKKDKTCWNCGQARNRTRSAEAVEQECSTCERHYLALVGQGELIGMCPFFFDHYGWNAYYPPNVRPDYLWDLNGYDCDDVKQIVTKRAV